MKYKNLAVIASVLSLAAAASAADISSHFVNLDFDSGVVNTGFGYNGFDNPNADIIGWRNLNNAPALGDSGVEGPGAWWNPYQDKAAFMIPGAGAYNLSDYTIQAGDLFDISYFASEWDWHSANDGAWTISLFYDVPANVIGSFVQTLNGGHAVWSSGAYSAPAAIAATAASEGHQLGIQLVSTGLGFAQIDELTITTVPEPATFSLVALAGLGLVMMRRKNC
jgi:hypothetical protein